MDKIIVEKGATLEGRVNISGAKNAALPLMAAALLSKGKSRFTNVPGLVDVRTLGSVLDHLGADCQLTGHTVEIDASGFQNEEAPYDLVRRMRASVLVLGPMVARLKKARVSLPGGCAIGARPIDQHLKGLERMGATVELAHGYVNVTTKGLVGADIYLDIPTVTGTENLMMAAVLAKGTTVLRNTAREPEITNLGDCLNSMGAKIEGAGTNVITIEGVEELAPADFPVIGDRIEAGTFMVAAGLTGGRVELTGADSAHLQALIHKLEATNVHVEEKDGVIAVERTGTLLSADVKTQPFPGFPTDMQAQFMVLMSVASGLSVITETIFENRYIHVSELQRLGADISISGSAAVVRGKEKLSGAPVMATDLRASASLVLAGLIAEGRTEINRVYHLDRGYEAMEEKFKALGANIRREKT